MQELVQVLGALVTIAGLVIVAPFEAGRALPAVWRSTASTMRRARNWLSRWLPFLRRNVRVNIGSMTAITSAVTASITGRVGLTDQGTTEEQLAAIRAAVASIHTELDGLRAEDRAIRAELTAKLDQLAQDHTALRQALEEQRQEQGQINARGVPLAAVGALLAGLPGSWLVAAGWWLGGPLVVVARGRSGRTPVVVGGTGQVGSRLARFPPTGPGRDSQASAVAPKTRSRARCERRGFLVQPHLTPVACTGQYPFGV